MTIKKILNDNDFCDVEYDEMEFEVLSDDGWYDYLHYIGDGSKPIHNPKGNTSCYRMFDGFDGEHLDFSEFNTENITDMSLMFSNCEGLVDLDLSGFYTGNVKDMSFMFNNCSSIEKLDLSNFDTSEVMFMINMFSNCGGLKTLNLSNFNMGNVRDVSNMFMHCFSLTKNPLKNVDMHSIENMEYMYYGCISLKSFNMNTFDNLCNVSSMRSMFENCFNLQSFICTKGILSKSYNVSFMFYGCTSISNIKIILYNYKNADTEGMFDKSKLNDVIDNMVYLHNNGIKVKFNIDTNDDFMKIIFSVK